MTSEEKKSSSSSPASPLSSSAKPGKSRELKRTLLELESAIAHWDNLNSNVIGGNNPTEKIPEPKPQKDSSLTAPQPEREFREKAKKLLVQLREQINELAE